MLKRKKDKMYAKQIYIFELFYILSRKCNAIV